MTFSSFWPKLNWTTRKNLHFAATNTQVFSSPSSQTPSQIQLPKKDDRSDTYKLYMISKRVNSKIESG